MATLRQQVIPLSDYPTGERTFGPFNVPDSATSFYLEVARCTTATPDIWPNEATTFSVAMEGSTDNGQTWIPAGGGGGSPGGIRISHGAEIPNTTITVPLPALTNRKMRITTTIVNGPLRTQGFAELRD